MKLLYLILVCASALKLKEQPSGFFNFSRINNITLPSKSSIDSKLYVYTVPNVLRITAGMIAFPNDLYYDSPYPSNTQILCQSIDVDHHSTILDWIM